MLLRLMRRPRAGAPSTLARILAALVVLGMVALAAPVVAAPVGAALRWLLAQL